MRIAKLFTLALTVAVLCGVGASGVLAGIDPSDPGLPTVTAYGKAFANNALSAVCAACHTRTPYGSVTAGSTGTHFVLDGSAGSITKGTNSGGGYTSADYSVDGNPRNDNGTYLHTGGWTTTTIYSKYGSYADNASYTTAPTGTEGFRACTTVAADQLYNKEIICESCHNVIVNVSGGNNLVDNPGDLATPGNWAASATATLCVGCHGWMYAESATNTAQNAARYDNVWNRLAENAGNAHRTPNHKEYKDDGVPHANNHHMGTGDMRNQAIATAYLNWSPTAFLPPEISRAITTAPTDAVKAYALKGTWGTGFTKPGSGNEDHFSCLACHATGHGGHGSTGGTLLRGTASGPATSPIDRITDRGNIWKDQDQNLAAGAGGWCQNCHQN